MKFVIVLKKLALWLKRYVGFLCPVYLLILSLCSEITSTINSFTKDELGGLLVGVARKKSVEGGNRHIWDTCEGVFQKAPSL